MTAKAPLAMLLELTHRCPLQCPYCSNPLDLKRAGEELTTAEWIGALKQAAAMGVLQVHFSGGEPSARRDLEEIVSAATGLGLYSNLITSGVLLSEDRLRGLAARGLDHVQLSIQGATASRADRVAGLAGAHEKKLAFAKAVYAADLPLTLNAVMHRQNLDELPAILDLAVAMGAGRLEVAHTQYYGWGLANRAALMPTREQIDAATAEVDAARERLKGRLVIDYVTPDYYAERPKACMGGWGQSFIVVTPTGDVWPCHAAGTIPGLVFDNLKQKPLGEIWRDNSAFNAYRGTAWMPAPCQGCERAEIDGGGCRCQAYALNGNAATTDPVCTLSPLHDRVLELAQTEATDAPPEFRYRNFANAEGVG